MKTLRNILYVITAIFLGIFIYLLSISLLLKNVVQDELITNVVKSTITNEYVTKNVDKLTPEQKKMLDDFLNNNDSDEVVNILVDNYINYQNNENYKISQKDVDTLKNYINNHKDIIKQVSDKDINIDDILNEITVENIDEMTKKNIEKMDELPAEVQTAVITYKNITMGPVKIALAFLVIGCIALLMLISWSFIKWMKATGICFITNGVLITLLFIFADGIKDILVKNSDIGVYVKNMTFSNILIIGLVELVVGILLIVIHKLLNKKSNDSNLKIDDKSKNVDN